MSFLNPPRNNPILIGETIKKWHFSCPNNVDFIKKIIFITIHKSHRTFFLIKILSLCFQILCVDIFKIFYYIFLCGIIFKTIFIKTKFVFRC
jgi:hypothetical protein